MAIIKEILEIEKTRTAIVDWRKIHLFQEGSFYRAYEVSAWLCWMHLNKFKVTHREMKGLDQTVAFVGFPLTSLEKWKPAGCEIGEVSEKHLLLTLPAVSIVDGTDVKTCEEDFRAWKEEQPISGTVSGQKDSGRNETDGKREERPRLFSIAQAILAFPIESKSPIDCMLFLAEIRRKLACMM